MTYEGKVNRGLKWFVRNRDADGNLKPCVADDPNKMADIKVYLEHKKKLEEEKTKSKGKK